MEQSKETGIVVNSIVAYGRIISIETKGRNMVITMHSKNGGDIYPKFVVGKNAVLPENIIRKRVMVKGYTKGYKREKNGKTITEQYFVAEQIEPDKTMLERMADVKGIFFDSPKVEILYIGEVQGLVEDGNWVRYSIRLDETDTRGLSVVHVSMKKLERQPDIKYGDRVAMACYLSTPRKEIDGKMREYEDIIVVDIAKL